MVLFFASGSDGSDKMMQSGEEGTEEASGLFTGGARGAKMMFFSTCTALSLRFLDLDQTV